MSSNCVQNPRFVYVENDSDKTFPIRFAPMDTTPATATVLPSESETPTDSMPITPLENRRIDFARIETTPTPRARGSPSSVSPNVVLGDEGLISKSILKRPADGAKQGPKKRARVAFE